MIRSAEEFVELRDNDESRATHDKARKAVWMEVIWGYPEYKAWVIHNKTVPVSVLRVLARDDDADVRFAVAIKRKCPPDVLKRLARDGDEAVRARVAWNAKTPLDILEMLREDPSEEVAKVVACRLAGSSSSGDVQ